MQDFDFAQIKFAQI